MQKSPTSEKSKLFQAPSSMFWVGFLVRVLYITLAHTYKIRLGHDHFEFGGEMGRIARALATGFGYSDPFTGHTGPTAWIPPLYPLLLAAVFKVFGVYTAQSAWVILTINSIFSAATSMVIYEIAMRCFHSLGNNRARKIALWSGWLWALHPAAMQYAVRWVWDMAVTTFVFSKLVVLALRIRGIGEELPPTETQTTSRWAIFGVLSGTVGLINSSLLLFVPVCGLWMLLGVVKDKVALPRTLLKAAMAAALFFSCLTPWMWRNWTVFRAFVPIRGNFGAELHSSVAEGYDGFPLVGPIPICDACPKYKKYKQIGELVYVRQEKQLAEAYIRSHKLRFAQLSLKRFYFYWVSVPHPIELGVWNEAFRVLNYSFLSLAAIFGLVLALKQHIPGAALFAWAFVLLPLVYYFVTAQARFRHPLEPIMVILTVFLFQSATPRRKTSNGIPDHK